MSLVQMRILASLKNNLPLTSPGHPLWALFAKHMSNRQDKEKEAKLEPQRMQIAIDQLAKRKITIDYQDEKKLQFTWQGKRVTLYPYSGWFSGKTVNDGRGLKELLKQLKP